MRYSTVASTPVVRINGDNVQHIYSWRTFFGKHYSALSTTILRHPTDLSQTTFLMILLIMPLEITAKQGYVYAFAVGYFSPLIPELSLCVNLSMWL